MEIVPTSLEELITGHQVDPQEYLRTSLSSWASLSQKTPLVLRDIAQEIIICETLKELAPKLKEVGAKPLVLGGVSLWSKEYPELGMRKVCDLDLWVSPEDLESFEDVLRQHGFIQSEQYHMIWSRGPVEIDLHNHPMNNERGAAFDCLFKFDANDIWERGDPLPCCLEEPWRRPNKEDIWIQLCLHAIKHEFERLNLIIDLHLLLENHIPQSDFGRLLWKEVTPALESLQIKTLVSPEKPSTLAYKIVNDRPPFLIGLRLLAFVGKNSWKFWWTLAVGNSGVRRESGTLHRWTRISKRFIFGRHFREE